VLLRVNGGISTAVVAATLASIISQTLDKHTLMNITDIESTWKRWVVFFICGLLCEFSKFIHPWVAKKFGIDREAKDKTKDNFTIHLMTSLLSLLLGITCWCAFSAFDLNHHHMLFILLQASKIATMYSVAAMLLALFTLLQPQGCKSAIIFGDDPEIGVGNGHAPKNEIEMQPDHDVIE